MDFRGRASHVSSAPATEVSRPAPQPVRPSALGVPVKNNLLPSDGRPFKIFSVVLLFAVAALLVAMTLLITIGGGTAAASVQKDHYQAVFLNNGQVYFGKINKIGSKTTDLRGIYYLQTNNSSKTSDAATENSNVSIVKLGCELHAPLDQMVINNDQVIFWENIKDDGQVVKAIKEYGNRSCSEQSQNSTQQSNPASSTAPSNSPSSAPGSATTTPPATSPSSAAPGTANKKP